MTSPTCPRLFEVEAARDGRLAGPELTRFHSHLARCPSCSRQSQALQALGAALRGLPAVSNDDLHARRQRTRLLAAFDASLVPARSNARRWLVPLLATAALTILTLTLWHSRTPAPAPAAAVRDAITIQPAPATKWSRQVENHRETITLAAGTLSVAIDHSLSPRRVRVLLPDGDLEDLGTTFTITVTAAATTHVSVQEGTVILRLRNRAPIVLSANESWTPESTPPAPPATPSAPAFPAPANASAPANAPAPAPAPAPAGSTPAPPGDDAATDFRSALAALNGGNNALAASLFATFLTRHPSDARTEDAAYLRVIALQRSGNASATRDAARSYLERYPTAFRRTEIEPLAQ